MLIYSKSFLPYTTIVLLLFLIITSTVHSIDTTGGNVTNLILKSFSNSTRWDGIYGEVVLGTGINYTHTVTGNKVVRINIIAQEPPCAYSSISIHVIAYNASAITLPLKAGNLTKLDLFIGNRTENASLTFRNTSTFILTSGTYVSVPTTYTYANNSSSLDFRMGYLNDAAGNLVFITKVVSNKPDWNGSTSDYQLLLPRSSNPTAYNITADVVYTCKPPPEPGPSGVGNIHRLYIAPIDSVIVKSKKPFIITAIVKNTGDFEERNVSVFIEKCPEGFSCGQERLSSLRSGKSQNVSITLMSDRSGEYVLSVCAKSAYTKYCREFIVKVLAECSVDSECSLMEYCDGGVCTPKKQVGEQCTSSRECKSNLCVSGYCVECYTSSDCAVDELCSRGICTKISCDCGIIRNHQCMPYECCTDSMCDDGKVCVANKCVEKELIILIVKGEHIEGENVLVRVENNKGEPVPFAVVTTTDGQRLTTDENGYSTVRIPYDGLIYATAKDYPEAGVLLDVIRLGFIIVEKEVYVGVPTKVTVKDSKGKPIVNTILRVNGKEYVTDANGEAWLVFNSEGTFVLSGFKEKYMIYSTTINVVKAEKEACGFPVFLNIVWFVPKDLWILWVFSAFITLVNITIYIKRKKEGRKLRAIIYFVLPLLLAIPNVYPFNICFMSNIIVLQLLIELVVMIKNKLSHNHKKKK